MDFSLPQKPAGRGLHWARHLREAGCLDRRPGAWRSQQRERSMIDFKAYDRIDVMCEFFFVFVGRPMVDGRRNRRITITSVSTNEHKTAHRIPSANTSQDQI